MNTNSQSLQRKTSDDQLREAIIKCDPKLGNLSAADITDIANTRGIDELTLLREVFAEQRALASKNKVAAE